MSAIIFDFDGTIADSFEASVQIFYALSGHDHETLPLHEIQRLRSMSLFQAAEKLHVHPWKMPFLMFRGRRAMVKLIPTIEAHQGMPGTIRKLYDEGHQLFVVSSNSSRNIKQFLKQHHMYKEFVDVKGNGGLFGKSRLLRKVIKQNSLDPDDTWYVGDESRDIEASSDAGIRVIAVTWGFNSEQILRDHRPTALAKASEDIIRILEEA